MAISIRLKNARANDRRLRMLATRIKQRVEAAEAVSTRDAYREAIKLSSGRLTPGDKRRRGYPYAKKWGGSRIPGDPAYINVVRGVFRQKWRISGNRLINDADVAGFLHHGTRIMEDRPIRQRIIERTYWARVTRMKEAVRRAARST